MAGSYRHVTDKKGKFDGIDTIDNLGDAQEALQECVWMINYLAKGNLVQIFEAARAYVASPGGFDNPDYAKKMTAIEFWGWFND